MTGWFLKFAILAFWHNIIEEQVVILMVYMQSSVNLYETM